MTIPPRQVFISVLKIVFRPIYRFKQQVLPYLLNLELPLTARIVTAFTGWELQGTAFHIGIEIFAELDEGPFLHTAGPAKAVDIFLVPFFLEVEQGWATGESK